MLEIKRTSKSTNLIAASSSSTPFGSIPVDVLSIPADNMASFPAKDEGIDLNFDDLNEKLAETSLLRFCGDS